MRKAVIYGQFPFAMGYQALDALLAFSGNIPPGGSHIVITDTLGADANFLLHHFIANQLKADGGGGTGKAVLVGLAHIFNHYAIVGKKLVGAIGRENF